MPAPVEPWLRMQSALSAFSGPEITTRELAIAAGFPVGEIGRREYIVAGLVLRANGWASKRRGAGDRPRVYARPTPTEASAA